MHSQPIVSKDLQRILKNNPSAAFTMLQGESSSYSPNQGTAEIFADCKLVVIARDALASVSNT